MADVLKTGARAPTADRFSLARLFGARETGVFVALLVLCLFLSVATDGFLTSAAVEEIGLGGPATQVLLAARRRISEQTS